MSREPYSPSPLATAGWLAGYRRVRRGSGAVVLSALAAMKLVEHRTCRIVERRHAFRWLAFTWLATSGIATTSTIGISLRVVIVCWSSELSGSYNRIWCTEMG